MKSFKEYIAEADQWIKIAGRNYFARGEFCSMMNQMYAKQGKGQTFPSASAGAKDYMAAMNMENIDAFGNDFIPLRGGSVLNCSKENLLSAFKKAAESHLSPVAGKSFPSKNGNGETLDFDPAKYWIMPIPWSPKNPAGYFLYFTIDASYSGANQEAADLLANAIKKTGDLLRKKDVIYKRGRGPETILFQDIAVVDYLPRVSQHYNGAGNEKGFKSANTMQYGLHLGAAPDKAGKNIFELPPAGQAFTAHTDKRQDLINPAFYKKIFDKAFASENSIFGACAAILKNFLAEASKLGADFQIPGI
jgi:hypothetical protein